jgi:hypothetical protein
VALRVVGLTKATPASSQSGSFLRRDAGGRVEDEFAVVVVVEVEHGGKWSGEGVEGAVADPGAGQPVALDEAQWRGTWRPWSIKAASGSTPQCWHNSRPGVNNLQVRAADTITAFAGSMMFVYIHAVLFAVWMIFLEKDPWPKLTLFVSLEAIFLSTFVMIGQNWSAEFQQAKANRDFIEQEQELKINTALTREIEVLTKEIHERVLGDLAANPATGGS